MESLRAKVERLKAELTNTPVDDIDNRNRISNQIAEAEYEMKSQQDAEQEQAAREQKTEELIGEYNETLNSIFDALLPEDKFTAILGLNEYEQLRQDYKRVHNAYYSDKVANINKEHVQEIEGWRQKFGRLTNQAQAAENQLAEANKTIEHLQEVSKGYDELKREHEELEKTYGALERVNIDNVRELEQLRQENEELKSKLEQAQKPKEPAQSETLTNVLNEIKSRKQMDPDELMRRFNARQTNGGKIMAIDHSSNKVELPELPFRTPMDSQMVAPSPDPLPTIVTQDQFRGSDGDILQPSVLPSNGDGTTANTMGSSNDETVSLAARIEALEADVKALKLMNGMVA